MESSVAHHSEQLHAQKIFQISTNNIPVKIVLWLLKNEYSTIVAIYLHLFYVMQMQFKKILIHELLYKSLKTFKGMK